MSAPAPTETITASPPTAAPGDPWLCPLTGAADLPLRLVCFPYAGGGPQAFRGLSDAVGAEVDVWGVALPGRGTRVREAPVTRLEPIVAAAATAVTPLLDRPVAFFGHSLGALVAFEVLRELRRRGLPRPLRLFASAARAPHRPPDEPLHGLSDEAFLARIAALGGTPTAVLRDAQLMELLLPALRADFEVAETYQCTAGRPVATPILALGGREDPHVSPTDLRGWGWHTCGDFGVRTFAGDHFYLHGAERELANAIAADPALAEAVTA
jgi:medium-chain acyl-[acyl-carrier-protein] hydrolase